MWSKSTNTLVWNKKKCVFEHHLTLIFQLKWIKKVNSIKIKKNICLYLKKIIGGIFLPSKLLVVNFKLTSYWQKIINRLMKCWAQKALPMKNYIFINLEYKFSVSRLCELCSINGPISSLSIYSYDKMWRDIINIIVQKERYINSLL